MLATCDVRVCASLLCCSSVSVRVCVCVCMHKVEWRAPGNASGSGLVRSTGTERKPDEQPMVLKPGQTRLQNRTSNLWCSSLATLVSAQPPALYRAYWIANTEFPLSISNKAKHVKFYSAENFFGFGLPDVPMSSISKGGGWENKICSRCMPQAKAGWSRIPSE